MVHRVDGPACPADGSGDPGEGMRDTALAAQGLVPKAGHRAESGGHHRHHGQVVDDVVPARVDRDIGVPHLLKHLYAATAAGALDEPDKRQPELTG